MGAGDSEGRWPGGAALVNAGTGWLFGMICGQRGRILSALPAALLPVAGSRALLPCPSTSLLPASARRETSFHFAVLPPDAAGAAGLAPPGHMSSRQPELDAHQANRHMCRRCTNKRALFSRCTLATH